MDIQGVVIGFAIIAATLISAQLLSPLTRLPVPTIQLLLGVVVTNTIISLGVDTGLRFDNFHDLVFYLFLPVLVFTAAWEVDAGKLRANLIGVAGLAFLGLLLTTALTASAVYYAIDHPGFPWVAAFLTAALLAATDPAAVTSQAWVHHVRPKLALLLEGESLFNDATAVVLFTVILSIAMTQSQVTESVDAISTVGQAGLTFVIELAGGALIGLIAGLICRSLDRQTHLSVKLWLGLSVALGAYHFSLMVHASGVIACLVIGLMLGRHSDKQPESAQSWRFFADTTNGILFILMGATITWSMFAERWLAMLFAIAAVVGARFISVHAVLALQNSISHTRYSWPERHMTGLLGMRGAITIALVLVLPVDLPYWWTIQSIAYGVVLFDLLVTAPLMPWLIGRSTASQGKSAD